MNTNNPLLQSNALMYITKRPEIIFMRGQDSWLFDHTGKRYLDFLQGWAVNCLGHAHHAIINAIDEQVRKLINPSPAFYNEPMMQLANLLVENSCFDKVFFANSGAEANEGAIKLARKWGEKYKNCAYEIISLTDSFHGRTLATMSASGKFGWDNLFLPKMPGFLKARINDIDSVAALIGPKTAAIMLEPILGEAGVLTATTEFLHSLRSLCDQHKLLLIFDEIQTGCGRTGKLFAYQGTGESVIIEPDIMTLGKGIGGGVPLSALLCKKEYAVFELGDQGGTFNGNPLMCAVGLAVLKELLSHGFLDSVVAKGQYLSAKLQDLVKKFNLIGERGEGLLRALVLADNNLKIDRGAKIVELALNLTPDGLLLNSPKNNVLRFMPALNIKYEEIDLMINLLSLLFESELPHSTLRH